MTFHEISAGLKARGRYSLLGHLGTAIGANILYIICSMLLTMIASGLISGTGLLSLIMAEVLSFVISLFVGIFEYGLCSIYTNLQYAQPAFVRDIYAGFRENPDKIIRIQAVRSLVQILCTLPAVAYSYLVPGQSRGQLAVYYVIYILGELLTVVLLLGLDMSFYILLDYPDMSAQQAMKTSFAMMKGNRRLLLYIYCSFLPLYVLSVLSFGIAGLWVVAYRHSTIAAFYRGLVASRAK